MNRDPVPPSSPTPSPSDQPSSSEPLSSAQPHQESPNGMNRNGLPRMDRETQATSHVNPASTSISPTPSPSGTAASQRAERSRSSNPNNNDQPPGIILLVVALIAMGLGLVLGLEWLGWVGSIVALLLSLRIIWALFKPLIADVISPEQFTLVFALIGGLIALIGLYQLTNANEWIAPWFSINSWEEIGALGDVIGALGQILIAVLAVYIAWRQYIISKDLTIQQNLITQQQTIDAYFQGISDLVLDAEGLLEDWPQERAIAEGRTAAILSSVDPTGKAKIVRFLSRSRLLTPLKRDRHLGRAMLDGMGGYQEDRDFGIRVIDLGVMLAASQLAGTDLRWTDLSDTNMVRANLVGCDLVKSNLARSILYEANLRGADLMGARLFYGSIDTATPRTRTEIPDYKTGTCTGTVVENADFSGVQRLSEQQRQYICAWGGEKTRSTVPGGCGDIPNKLGR